MDARIQGQYTPSVALKATTLAIKCLATEPKYRPKMVEVVHVLEQLQDTGIVRNEEIEKQRRTSTKDSSRKAASYPRPSASPIAWIRKKGREIHLYL